MPSGLKNANTRRGVKNLTAKTNNMLEDLAKKNSARDQAEAEERARAEEERCRAAEEREKQDRERANAEAFREFVAPTLQTMADQQQQILENTAPRQGVFSKAKGAAKGVIKGKKSGN